jgi:hypothetical protein
VNQQKASSSGGWRSLLFVRQSWTRGAHVDAEDALICRPCIFSGSGSYFRHQKIAFPYCIVYYKIIIPSAKLRFVQKTPHY